jgi:type II secretory pathway component HofQ
MKMTLLLLMAVSAIGAEPKRNQRAAIEPPTVPQSNESKRGIHEYSGEEIAGVIRDLARKERINVVVSDSVKGTVNIRLEDKTAREIIDVIVQANELMMDELNGVYYIRTWDDPLKITAELMAHRGKLLLDAYLKKGFTRAEAMDLIRYLPEGAKVEPAREPFVTGKRPSR